MQVVILGKEKGRQVSRMLLKNLREHYSVTYLDQTSLLCPSRTSSPDIFLIQTDHLKTVQSPFCLLVVFEEMSISELEEISPETLVLIYSKNQKWMEKLSALGISVVSCGMSEKDTLNFSSVGNQSSVVSLQRVLQLGEKLCEPMDITLNHPQEMDPFAMLIYTAIVILLEQGERAKLEIKL